MITLDEIWLIQKEVLIEGSWWSQRRKTGDCSLKRLTA
jgi:hypothetical protein